MKRFCLLRAYRGLKPSNRLTVLKTPEVYYVPIGD